MPKPRCASLAQRQLQDAPRVQRHRRAVLEPRLAAQPARALRPGQLLEAGRVGQQDQVAGERKARQLGRAAGFEHLERGAVRGVFQQQRADHADPRAQGLHGGLGRQRLAAQHAVQVAPAEAHQLQAAGLDQAGGVQRRSFTRVVMNAALFRE
ncbi:hypothetical protein [Candidatus Skiveiella danica]|uniref:hypothetical protein n=1 Tax=Candidatus Skiveiella danica TaxID=3386177 RepID=UPI0039B855EC